jgi:predicted nuclease of restriction endonuclease-like (RecB) superfamily
LNNCRKFYSAYRISCATHTKSTKEEIVYNAYEIPKFTLSWNHYQILMRIANLEERNFYEIEAQQQGWDYRWLQRQVGSSLYERLALSRNKNEVMRLATEGQVVEKPADIIKSPISLEFIGLKPDSSYSESTLENAIIDKMQTFLLEMGKGFLFEARQKRFTFDEDNYYVDLVLYNRLLQCYCLIELLCCAQHNSSYVA